jgi:hypothetical protein
LVLAVDSWELLQKLIGPSRCPAKAGVQKSRYERGSENPGFSACAEMTENDGGQVVRGLVQRHCMLRRANSQTACRASIAITPEDALKQRPGLLLCQFIIMKSLQAAGNEKSEVILQVPGIDTPHQFYIFV